MAVYISQIVRMSDFNKFYSKKLILILIGFFMSSMCHAGYIDFPVPTGKYCVGTRSLHVVDHSRNDPYIQEALQPRELMVTAWYPTDEKLAQREKYAPPYLMDCLKNLFRSFEGITPEDLEEFDLIRVPVIQNASISGQEHQFPLIIFSHGYYSSRYYSSALCQELASHGYIVLAPDHTFDAGITQMPDGTNKTWASLTGEPLTSDAFYETFNTRVSVRVADICFLLDYVTRANDVLCARLDLSKIGAFGHSLGAEAVLQAAAVDDRIKAIVPMDIFPIGTSVEDNVHVACMALCAELTDWSKLDSSEQVRCHFAKREQELKSFYDYQVMFKRADHIVFSDFSLFAQMNIFKKTPAAKMFSIGTIDGLKAICLANSYLVAFFDRYVRGQAQGLLMDGVDDEFHCMSIKRGQC